MYDLKSYLVMIGYVQTENPHKEAICFHPPRRTFWEPKPGTFQVVADDGSQITFTQDTIVTCPQNDMEGPTIRHFRD